MDIYSATIALNMNKGGETMDRTVFEQICKMSQKQIKKYVKRKLSETHKDIVSGDGYVFAQGDFPVLLVAHMDTVHKALPNAFIHDKKRGTISSPNGIGGDDRCGIYMILEVIKKINCSVLFTEDEETGCIGAHKFAGSSLVKQLAFNYIIEFDRANANDAVFYDCDNPEFEEFITKEFYKTSYGSFSDISVIAPVLGCAAVNLSCGYYNAHTKNEYVVLSEMENSIEAALQILYRTSEDDAFEYIEAESYYSKYYSGYSNYSGYSRYNSGYNDYLGSTYAIRYRGKDNKIYWTYIYASCVAEAVGKFLMLNETMMYKDILQVTEDKEYDGYY